jgi:hypothetical protein
MLEQVFRCVMMVDSILYPPNLSHGLGFFIAFLILAALKPSAI